MSQRPNIVAKKPTSVWKRPVSVNFSNVGTALAKVGSAVVLQEWINVAEGVVDVASAAGISTRDTAETAWLLIYRASLQAMIGLGNDYPGLTSRELRLEFLYEQLDAALEKSEITVDSTFFEQPKRLPILKVIAEPFFYWLRSNGVPTADAQAISARLPRYFVYELNHQWGKNPEAYIELSNKLDTPFKQASKREYAWERYGSWLQKRVDEPMFGEAFSIRQIYIPLRAYYVETRRRKGLDDMMRQVCVVVDLEKELNSWLEKNDKEDFIRVICGGPGCGKSSFTKIWAAKIAEEGIVPVLLISMIQIDPSKDLSDAIEEWIQTDLENMLPPNPLSQQNAEKKVLLIFDGLDELALQGNIFADMARKFIDEVIKKLEGLITKKRAFKY
jgi:hypothetical protein